MRCSLQPSRDTERIGAAPQACRRGGRWCFAVVDWRRRLAPTAHAQSPSPSPTRRHACSRPRRQINSDISAGSQVAQSRQQLPGAARQPGHRRFRPRRCGPIPAAAAPPKRPRIRVTAPGARLYGISITTDPQGDFVGDKRKTLGGVAGFGARVAPGVNLGFSVDQSRTDDRRAARAAIGDARSDPARLQRLRRQGAVDLGLCAGARLRQGPFQPRHRRSASPPRLSRRRSTAR